MLCSLAGLCGYSPGLAAAQLIPSIATLSAASTAATEQSAASRGNQDTLVASAVAYTTPGFNSQATSIQQLALSLARRPEAKAAFAVDALSEMAASLDAETALARQQAHATDNARSLRRWIAAVDGYTAQILALAGSIDIGTPVALSVGKDNGLFIVVRGQSIMLSAPRRELQSSLEQMVINRFCSHHPCDESLRSRATATQVGVAASQPRWRFGDAAGPSCVSDDGIVLEFSSSSRLGAKREFCQQLVSELRVIAFTLKQQKQRGVRVELDALKVYAIPAMAEHQLDFNTVGNSAQLILPVSYAMPQLLQQARPWIRARADNRRATLVLDNAEELFRSW